MSQSNQNRVVLGALAAAGFIVVLYIIAKKLTRRKAGKDGSSEQQPEDSVELNKSGKSVSKTANPTPDSQSMSTPVSATVVETSGAESMPTLHSKAEARSMAGSMFFDSYGGYQVTHPADTVSVASHHRKIVMAETMSGLPSPRVSWQYSEVGSPPASSTTTSQADVQVTPMESKPHAAPSSKERDDCDEPPLKTKPCLNYNLDYGGNFMTNTSYTMSISSQKDRKFVVSESMSELKGPRVAWHTDDDEPITLTVAKEAEQVKMVVTSKEEVLRAQESTKYKEAVYSMEKGSVFAEENPSDVQDGHVAGFGGAGEALASVERTAEELETTLHLDELSSDVGAGDAIADVSELSRGELGSLPLSPAKQPSKANSQEEVLDGQVFRPAWMKKNMSKSSGSVSSSNSKSEGQTSKPPPSKEEATRVASTSSKPAAAAAAAPMDMEAVTDAIMASQRKPDAMTERHIQTLVSILQGANPSLLLTGLGCISRCANFSQNQRLLREAGCVDKLQALLESHGAGARAKITTSEAILTSTLMVIINMATDLENQAKMEVCLKPLMDLVMSKELSDEVHLSALQVLTNLSVTSTFHGHYTQGIQQLYWLLESSIPQLQLQVLRVLVNLSCNPDMVGHLLAAKAPANLLAFLGADISSGLPLRTVTFLANVEAVVRERKLSSSSLPTKDKAASPETLYSTMHGEQSRGMLRSKVFLLTNSPDEDIAYHAKRLYSSLSSS